MKPELCDLLVDPIDGGSLRLGAVEWERGEILEAVLHTEQDRSYKVHKGIPRLLEVSDVDQGKTSAAFAYKWRRRDTYDSAGVQRNLAAWLVEKYGYESLDAWVADYERRETVLDVGCGSGLSSSLWLGSELWKGQSTWIGVDISEAIDVCRERLGHVPNTHFVQADALALPFAPGSIDLVFSEGVLHHTPSTREGIAGAARVLKPGGELHFYVYRKKGPIREFTDDYVRDAIGSMSEDEAWSAMEQLTTLGRSLAELKTEVAIPDDVPLLGIEAGTHDVQRLVYWNFAKVFWNEGYSFQENVHVNFDWYRPRYAHRHTRQEIEDWCAESALLVTWMHEQESGFTVRAERQ